MLWYVVQMFTCMCPRPTDEIVEGKKNLSISFDTDHSIMQRVGKL